MRCQICTRSYSNSARKYGETSCNFCAAFFHRSVQLKKKFVCKSSNNCLKEPSLEGSHCQKCRFTKCLELGLPKPQMTLQCPIGTRAGQKRKEPLSPLDHFKRFCNPNCDI